MPESSSSGIPPSERNEGMRDPSGAVRAITVSGDRIYVGGEFEEVAGSPSGRRRGGGRRIWRGVLMEPRSGRPRVRLRTPGRRDGRPPGRVVREGRQTPRNALALVDAAGGSTGFNARIAGGFSEIHAIARTGQRLWVAGSFSSVGGRARDNLAAVDPSSGALLPWRLQGADSFGSVNALAIGGDALIVAGYPGGGNAGQLVVRPLRER